MSLENVRQNGLDVRVDLDGGSTSAATRHGIFTSASEKTLLECKHADPHLCSSEARLRLAVKAANVGFWKANLRTNRVIYSREWKSILGYAEDEITDAASEWTDRIHPADLPATMALVDRFLAHPQTPFEYEFRLRHKDGSWRWICSRGEVLPGEDGKPEWMLGCHVDITERKTAEIALRRNEERFRTMVEGAGVILWECEPGSRTFAYVSPQAARLGYPIHEWYAPDFWAEHIHPEDRERVVAHSRAECAAGRSHRLHYRMLAASGETVWIEDYVNIEVGEDGTLPLEERGVLIDITEHRRLTEAVRESEAFLRNAIDSLDSHTVVLDSNGRIVSVNRSWREFAAQNGGDEHLVHEGANYIRACERAARCCPEAGRIAELIVAVLAGAENPPSVEYACHAPQEQRWFRASVRGFTRGNERFVVVSHNNITESRLAAEQAAEAARRESFATIVGGIAHEFNSSLLAAATLLHAVEPGDGPGREGRNAAGSAVARASELIQQAQSLSAALLDLYAGPERADQPVVRLRGWLDERVARLAMVMPDGVSVSLSYADGALGNDAYEAQVDPLALERVLRILFVNASDALQGRGELRVEVKREGSGRAGPGRVVFTVTDNGPGVAPEHRARLFDPFFTTRSRAHRSGLGLSIASRLIEQTGGNLSFRAAEPTGSTFVISLAAPQRTTP